ncbi:MAG: FtsQ-type POTRA domain-containing protein [Ruminococcus sp.]|nr:FtsQ-type POTRA domain-containing protein [Ruminococcus sp.]
MNDIEKTTIERVNSGKRMRRRRRFMSVYALIVLLLVVFAGVVASLTFLFKVNEIIISGESDTYTYMEVVNAAGIRAGDNLIRMNTDDNEKNITDTLLLVEEADVDKIFPSTIKIHVSQCIPAFNVEYIKDDGEGGVLQVSRHGKILGINDFYVNDLPTIYGYDIEPESMVKGTVMQSSVSEKQTFYNQLVERFSKWDGSDIVYIDMTDPYNIEICYRSGIIFRMGDYKDVQYKLDLADDVMQDDSVAGKTGYLRMIGTNQCSFRMTEGPAEVPEIDPAALTTASAQPMENATTTTTSTDDGLYRPPGFVTTAAAQDWQTVPTTPQQDWNNGWQQDPWSSGQNNNGGWNGDAGQPNNNAGQNGSQQSGEQTVWQQHGYQSVEDWVNNRPAVGSEPDEGYFDEYGNFHYWWP